MKQPCSVGINDELFSIPPKVVPACCRLGQLGLDRQEGPA
jgi:hypothetical protein